MAMPFIIHHDENIYSMQEKETSKLMKPPRYSSKYREHIITEYRPDPCNDHRTMGYAVVPLDSPDKFLKRGGGFKPKPAVKDHVCIRRPLPPINKRKTDKKDETDGGEENVEVDAPTDGARCNALDDADSRQKSKATSASVAAVRPRFVDTIRGDVQDLRNSGMMPTYVYQKNFGKLPKYLIKRIRDAALQAEMFRDSQVRKQPLCRYVTQEERGELLGGLKHNWEELQKLYQVLPVLTDTIPKAMRKTKLETDLKQLEKDILVVENLPYIYVYSSSEDGQ